MQGGQYCFRHSEETKSEAMEASSNGGKGKKHYSCLGKPMRIKTPEDIKKLMAKSINKIWTGEMASNNPAGAIGYLAKTFLEAYGISDLQIEMEQLRQRLDKANI